MNFLEIFSMIAIVFLFSYFWTFLMLIAFHYGPDPVDTFEAFKRWFRRIFKWLS